ncbi:MAG: AMP-binding protein [Pseudomonadota bacterium]
MILARWLRRIARAHPDLPAVAIGDRVHLTYHQFAERAARVAGWLRAEGARPGDRIAIVSENRPEYLEALCGTWWAGCAAAPIDARTRGVELRRLLENADAAIILVGSKAATEVAAQAPETTRRLVRFGGAEFARSESADPIELSDGDPEMMAWLSYTAGRGGVSKGAMLSHRALASMTVSMLAEVNSVVPRDAQIQSAPLSDAAGFSILPAIARGGVNVTPESAGFDEAEAFELAAAWRRASILVCPWALRQMTRSGADDDPSAFKSIIATGDAMHGRDAVEALDRFGPRLAQIYGEAEFPMTIARLSKHDVADRGHERWRDKLASVGRPFLEADVSIRRADGDPTEADEIGEICVRGPAQMTGYWRAPAETRAAIDRGWLRTGDLGVFDALGYLRLVGRRDEVAQVGGEEVHPRAVEAALLEHPEVEQAAVRADGAGGLDAFVVGAAGARALRAHCDARLPDHARPSRITLLDDLPRGCNGAVLKDRIKPPTRTRAGRRKAG